MSLKILAAGCSKEDRERVEALVRAVLGRRPAAESWAVSLVKSRDQWSVTLDGPDNRLRGLTFRCGEQRLSASLTEALRGAGFLGPPPAGSSPTAPVLAPKLVLGQRQDRHDCGKCGKPFIVCYEAQANEPQEAVSVACPHCWDGNVVTIGQWAATGRDYRAQKADG